MLNKLLVRANRFHSVHSYRALVSRRLREHPGNRDLAMIMSVGSLTMEDFMRQGDGHVAVLRHHGLRDGMAVYDLGCGSGRTAQALVRSGWQGNYKGADIERRLVAYLKDNCPGYDAVVHRKLSIDAPDGSQDMIFLWSVFTHLYPEECYLYLRDMFRALKPGGKVVLSFLEIENAEHREIFKRRARSFERHGWSSSLDAFLHRDWLRIWAEEFGFSSVAFTEGQDASAHPPFWQTLAVMTKPA
jgi:SAM-dependent methyltransferase